MQYCRFLSALIVLRNMLYQTKSIMNINDHIYYKLYKKQVLTMKDCKIYNRPKLRFKITTKPLILNDKHVLITYNNKTVID